MVRRFAIASTILVSATVLSAPAFAADTADLTIDGTVNTYRNVTVAGAGTYDNLPLGGEGTGVAAADSIQKIGDITILSNNNEGVAISAEDGTLIGGAGVTDTIAYDVKLVLDAATAPGTTDFADGPSALNVDVDDSTGAGAADLYIMYTTPTLLDPGNYADTITVSITGEL